MSMGASQDVCDRRIFFGKNKSINGDQEPITRSVIARYIMPSAQSQKCLFLAPDFPRKAVTMMTAAEAKNMADKLLPQSVFRTSNHLLTSGTHSRPPLF